MCKQNIFISFSEIKRIILFLSFRVQLAVGGVGAINCHVENILCTLIILVSVNRKIDKSISENCLQCETYSVLSIPCADLEGVRGDPLEIFFGSAHVYHNPTQLSPLLFRKNIYVN